MSRRMICFLVLVWIGACAQDPRAVVDPKQKPRAPVYAEILGEIVNKVEVSEDHQNLSLGDELIASFAVDEEIISSAGSFRKGRTLNFLNIDGVEFLIYGEDGAFAAECEPHAEYPSHDRDHPNCRILGAESFDTWIMCSARDPSVDTSIAEAWPGVPVAMESDLGMRCWKDGVLQESDRFFTY